MQTAVVTGAAGFVGSNLSLGLLEAGYTVRGLDNFSTGQRSNSAELAARDGFTLTEGDMCDSETVRDVLAGADIVFHQAAVPSVPRSIENPRASTHANCTGTVTVLSEAVDAGVDRVITASSSSIYGSHTPLPQEETMPNDPESPYALTKDFAERITLQFDALYDIDTVALRYFNVFGPRQDPNGAYAAVIPKFVSMMLDGERPTVHGDGEQSRDFTYIENVVQANQLAAEADCSGEVCNVACGERTTINELVEAINESLGTAIEPAYSAPREGDIRHSHADISKAERLLGYEPTVGFDEGIERTVAALDS